MYFSLSSSRPSFNLDGVIGFEGKISCSEDEYQLPDFREWLTNQPGKVLLSERNEEVLGSYRAMLMRKFDEPSAAVVISDFQEDLRGGFSLASLNEHSRIVELAWFNFLLPTSVYQKANELALAMMTTGGEYSATMKFNLWTPDGGRSLRLGNQNQATLGDYARNELLIPASLIDLKVEPTRKMAA